MRIVSIIVIDTKIFTVRSMKSFAIVDEQISQEVIDQAEALFEEVCIENGYVGEDISTCLDNGFCDIYDSGAVVQIVWSEVDGV